MHQISIDLGKCTGCQSCVKACFQDVLRWDEKKRVPKAVYTMDCHACCLCELVCPASAIKVTPDWKDVYWPPVIAHKKR